MLSLASDYNASYSIVECEIANALDAHQRLQLRKTENSDE